VGLLNKVPNVQVSDTTGDATKDKCWHHKKIATQINKCELNNFSKNKFQNLQLWQSN
jgi:hypothetical protein